MKPLKLILTLTLVAAVLSIAVAAYNLIGLYRYEKAETMETVRKCAENAVMLEMINRMQSSEKASESFIRLNAIIESIQNHEGGPARTDTLKATLATILHFGLEFKDNNWHPDPRTRDSLFRIELIRNGLTPEVAFIGEKNHTQENIRNNLWNTVYRYSPSSTSFYEVFVSPMPGTVLLHLWGIIIPFIIVICLFTFLSIYLSRTIARMRTLEEMKDDFTHNMTHELKTPVAVAYSAADSMLRYYDQSDATRNKKFLKIILQRLNYLSGMIENILSISMERFKTMQLNMTSTALKPIVKEVADMISLKSDKPISIKIEIPEGFSVSADPVHVANIFSNLLDNAIKYSGESVDIKINAKEDKITISDNGIGIAQEYLPHIFDKFFRVPTGDHYDAGGYGLGLFYVRHVIELFGWGIKAASTPGEGTIFTIIIKR